MRYIVESINHIVNFLFPSLKLQILYGKIIKNKYTKQIFNEKAVYLENGVVSFPLGVDSYNKYIPQILGFKKFIAHFGYKNENKKIDVYTSWGNTSSTLHNYAENLSSKNDKPFLRLEFGFISGFDIALCGASQYSLIICPYVMYYDAYKLSFMDYILNSDFVLSDTQELYVKECIVKIVKNGITKYNGGSLSYDMTKFANTKIILIIDQKFGDASIKYGKASEKTYEKMFFEAYSHKDYKIIMKMHPDSIKSGKGSYLAKYRNYDPERVFILDEDINPYVLFKYVEKVYVATSQVGFEALMAGKEVHCFGVPFYSGWGITHDKIRNKFRRKKRNLREIFYVYYILCSKYYIPDVGKCDLSKFIDFIALSRGYYHKEVVSIDEKVNKIDAQKQDKNSTINILIAIPGQRFGATGRYIQVMAFYLKKQGFNVYILSEGYCRENDNGISWQTITFEGNRLSESLRRKVINFNPHIIFMSGSRTKVQRAVLEILVLTNAKLIIQNEDDDRQVYMIRNNKNNADILDSLSFNKININMIIEMLDNIDWSYSANVLLDPNYDRWVEPLMRTILFRMACAYTAIWYPMQKKLTDQFGKKVMIVPPAININKIKVNFDRNYLCNKYNIDEDSFIFFVAGTIYNYSNEFEIFIGALNLVVEMYSKNITFVFISKDDITRKRYGNCKCKFRVICLQRPNDDVYDEFLQGADVICSPGLPDEFTRLRLPSRFVKAMALGKPILTHICGFGESLKHKYNAILLQGNNPEEWALSIKDCLDKNILQQMGKNSRAFAEKYFDMKKVVEEFSFFLKEELKSGKNPFECLGKGK